MDLRPNFFFGSFWHLFNTFLVFRNTENWKNRENLKSSAKHCEPKPRLSLSAMFLHDTSFPWHPNRFLLGSGLEKAKVTRKNISIKTLEKDFGQI